MQPSLSEQLTHQFYEWEQLGRGWLFYEEPIELEPPFTPFFFHVLTQPLKVIDDGKRHSLLSWIAVGIKNILASKNDEQVQESEPLAIEPYLFTCKDPLHIFSVSLPKGYKVNRPEAEQLLMMLSDSKYPISFEILATSASITIQI